MSKNSMYYSSDLLFSHNPVIGFCMSGRGHGKSFEGKNRAIKTFLKDGSQTVYVRRTQKELDKVKKSYFNDISEFFPNCTFSVDGDFGYINGEIAIIFLALSTSADFKSASYPKVKLVIYDEFVIPQTSSYKRYLKNEMFLFFELFETIYRLRDGRILILSNAVSYVNPFFSFFGIQIKDTKKRFHKFKGGLIVVELYDNEEFKQKKMDSRFYKLVEGTPYAEYLVGEGAFEDDDSFLREERVGQHIFICSLVMDNVEVGIWFDDNGDFYCDDKIDYDSKNRFAVFNEDMRPHLKHIKHEHNKWRCKRIKEGYQNSEMYFKNQEIKKFIQKAIKYL